MLRDDALIFATSMFFRTHQARSEVSGVQDERAFGLSGKSDHPMSGEVEAVAPTKVHVGNRDQNGSDERGRPRRRRR